MLPPRLARPPRRPPPERRGPVVLRPAPRRRARSIGPPPCSGDPAAPGRPRRGRASAANTTSPASAPSPTTRRRVPLRDYEAFWSRYWRDAFPHLHGVTWPGRGPLLRPVVRHDQRRDEVPPRSRDRCWRPTSKAALTSAGLFLAAHPGTPLFTGRLFFLGGSTDLVDLRPVRTTARCVGGDLSGITPVEASPLMRPFTFPPPGLALLRDWEQKMTLLARARRRPADHHALAACRRGCWCCSTGSAGSPGKERIADVWPALRLVIHGGTKFDPYRDLFRRAARQRRRPLRRGLPRLGGVHRRRGPAPRPAAAARPTTTSSSSSSRWTNSTQRRPARHTVADVGSGVQVRRGADDLRRAVELRPGRHGLLRAARPAAVAIHRADEILPVGLRRTPHQRGGRARRRRGRPGDRLPPSSISTSGRSSPRRRRDRAGTATSSSSPAPSPDLGRVRRRASTPRCAGSTRTTRPTARAT